MASSADVRTMHARDAARSSGLDVSLLGMIVAGIGFTLDYVTGAAGTSPHLVRFFDKPAGTSYPAVMPQDAALLLLTDPSTTASRPISGGATAISLGDLPVFVAYVGAVLVVAGPLWAWYHR